MFSLIKSLLYIQMNRHISLRILKIIVVIMRGYFKCCNASLLIYRRFKIILVRNIYQYSYHTQKEQNCQILLVYNYFIRTLLQLIFSVRTNIVLCSSFSYCRLNLGLVIFLSLKRPRKSIKYLYELEYDTNTETNSKI